MLSKNIIIISGMRLWKNMKTKWEWLRFGKCWFVDSSLGEYKEEQSTLANFRNMLSYDNFHMHYEKLTMPLEEKKYLEPTT